jgi:hypothetical protein
MVREEYLNLEFMYKFINSLCKRDGYHMTDFEFGKMSYYRNEDTPFVLRNNMGYNIVYKFEAWKLPEKFDLNKEIELDYAREPLWEQTKSKTFCFDLHSECIVECCKGDYEFQPNPPFFRLDNQLYYSIYHQPKALTFHYSKGRDIEDIKDYMEYMGIDCYNIMSIWYILLETAKGRIGRTICYENKEEANRQVHILLSKAHKCDQWRDVKHYYRLGIHKDNAPVFYTDNVLELTIPLAEDINKLNACLGGIMTSLREIHRCLTLMFDSVQSLMQSRICDLSRIVYLECFSKNHTEGCFPVSGFDDVLKRCMQEVEEVENVYIKNAKYIQKTLDDTGKTAYEEYQIKTQETYKRISANIQKIRPETLSVDSLCQIAKDFDLLEAQIKSRQRV